MADTDAPPDFDADTAVISLGDGRYGATLLERWNIVAGPNGGYLAAVIARAMTDTVAEPARGLRSLTVHFLTRPAFDEAEVSVEVLRQGRSVSTLRATMTQQGRPVCAALAAFSVPWASEVEWRRPLPGHAHDAGIDLAGRIGPPAAANWRGAPIIDAPFFSGEGTARVAQWIRTARPRPLDAIEPVAISDAIPPAAFPRLTTPAAMPTVDLTIHIRPSLPLDDPPADDLVYAECTTEHVADGFAEEDCGMWSADGRLLAHSRQLAITR